MYSRPVARLLWCAPSERKGCGSTLGQQELAVAPAAAGSGTACKTLLLTLLTLLTTDSTDY